MKLTKKHKRRKPIKLNAIDYIFWRIFCFFRNRKLYYKGENAHAALIVIAGFCYPITLLFTQVILYLTCHYKMQMAIWCLLLMLLINGIIIHCLYHRYTSDSRISRDNYKKFHDKWDNELPIVRNQRKQMIITWLAVSIIVCHILLIFDFAFLPHLLNI